MAALSLAGWIEEVQDYIAENSGLGYVVAENFTIGESFESDLQDFVRSRPGDQVIPATLVVYDAGGSAIPAGSIARAQRSLRFVSRSREHGQAAIDALNRLLEWMQRAGSFPTATFRTLVERAPRLPDLVESNRAGEHLAELIVTFKVLNR